MPITVQDQQQKSQVSLRIPHAERNEPIDLSLLDAITQAPAPPEPTTALVEIITPRRQFVPRYHRAVIVPQSIVLPTLVIPVPSTHHTQTGTPTVKRPPPLHFCYQCGATVPPWRSDCFHHNQRYGRGIPPIVRLYPVTMPLMSLQPQEKINRYHR